MSKVCCSCRSNIEVQEMYVVPLEFGGRDIHTNKVYICKRCKALLDSMTPKDHAKEYEYEHNI